MKTPSAQACLAINGEKIKQFRESLGVTQLYVATSLGVTVDTISRWENGRSPNMKLENAEKLVELLEVSLAEIEKTPETSSSSVPHRAPAPKIVARKTFFRKKWFPVFCVFLITGIVTTIFWRSQTTPKPDSLLAYRYLPAHTSPEQPFPVILKVQSSGNEDLSFIVKEFLPPSCKVIASQPDFFENGGRGRTIRWLGNVNKRENSYFAYLVKVQAGVEKGSKLDFSGYITLDGKDDRKNSVRGEKQLSILHYHWADSNMDNRIDDSEILTIYNSFDILEDIGVDIDEVRQIWASNGYRWDSAEKAFVILPWSQQ